MIVKNVIQEFYDSGFQVLAYQELNEFTGEYLLRYGGFQYPLDTGNYEAWCLLEGDSNRFKGARLLAKSLGVMNTWKEARALEPTDDTPTQGGYYWVRCKETEDQIIVRLLYVGKAPLVFMCGSGDTYEVEAFEFLREAK